MTYGWHRGQIDDRLLHITRGGQTPRVMSWPGRRYVWSLCGQPVQVEPAGSATGTVTCLACERICAKNGEKPPASPSAEGLRGRGPKEPPVPEDGDE